MQEFWTRLKNRLREPDFSQLPPTPAIIKKHPRVFGALAVVVLASFATFVFFYYKYAMVIEDKFGAGGVRTNSSVYAMPRQITKGDRLTKQELIARLQRAGFTEDASNPMGYYRSATDGIVVTNGPNAYFQAHTATIRIVDDEVAAIESQTANKQVTQYWLEPELITNLFDRDREKRRPVAYSEIPKHVIDALISVEDKRFYNHTGLDPIRMVKAAYVDIKEGRKQQGASTITMQLARSFWLEQEKTYGRKLAEILLTLELERRFTKQEILEHYVNEIYLGRRGSFSIHGFGEAARAYFGKDIRKLTIPEAATLVGIIQRPSYYNPFRYPERVKERRNLALQLMHANGYLDAQQLAAALSTDLILSPAETESSDAPFFVDLVNEDLQGRFQDWDFATNSYRVYSTLDIDLQQAAVESVQEGMAQLDKQLTRMRGKNKAGQFPQVALVAMDPYSGEIRALVGGRSYTNSQLNHALAKRQPGSSFKPFVYAAGMNDSVARAGKSEPITAASLFLDEPTSFLFNKQVYEPANYHDSYHGYVTVRTALAKSMNIPTIKAAEKVGYEKVANLVRSAGIRSPVMGTPSLALGSYEVTPIELAESYTIFPNKGIHVKRSFVTGIRDRKNRVVFTHQPEGNQVVDERVAFIMTNLMEEVIRSGTGAGARVKGFTAPAAGKTGTSRDGWFAGYTSKLLTVVWIGYDDNTGFEMDAAKSALPLWASFMKRAHSLRQYSGAKAFPEPKGLVKVNIDPLSGLLSSADCPSRVEYFVAGTQPKEMCNHFEFEMMNSDSLAMAEELSKEKELEKEKDKGRKNIFKSVLGIFRR